MKMQVLCHGVHADIGSGARYLKARDLDSVLATDHHSKLTHVDPSTDPHVLFSSEGTCIVQPEVTQGPYCTIIETVVACHLADFRQTSLVN